MFDFRRITLVVGKTSLKAQNDYILKIWGECPPCLRLSRQR